MAGWVHWMGSSNVKKLSKFAPSGEALVFAQSFQLDIVGSLAQFHLCQ